MKKNNGFSIIELLIVLSIIGVLAGLSLPQFIYVLKARQTTTCALNRIEIQNAERQFVVDNNRPSNSMDELMEKGYLSVYLKCPAGGMYLWINNASSVNPFKNLGCSVHYFPSLPPSEIIPLFTSDFSSMEGLTILSGKWNTSNAALFPVGGKEEHRIVFGDQKWKDYTVKVNTTMKGGSGKTDYGIYYRIDGNPDITGYVFQYDVSGNSFLVKSVVDGKEDRVIKEAALDDTFPLYNQSYEVVINVQGDRHSISIEGQIILDFRDSTFSSGMAGLRTWDNSKASFDNISVIL